MISISMEKKWISMEKFFWLDLHDKQYVLSLSIIIVNMISLVDPIFQKNFLPCFIFDYNKQTGKITNVKDERTTLSFRWQIFYHEKKTRQDNQRGQNRNYHYCFCFGKKTKNKPSKHFFFLFFFGTNQSSTITMLMTTIVQNWICCCLFVCIFRPFFVSFRLSS